MNRPLDEIIISEAIQEIERLEAELAQSRRNVQALKATVQELQETVRIISRGDH